MSNWASIAELMTAWGRHRDAGRWDRLADLFAPGAFLDLAWFHGSADDFVASCRQRSSGKSLRSKHVIANPLITVRGDRALAETDAQLLTDQRDLDLGAVTHIRFLDCLVRVGDSWRIAYRASIYDLCAFTSPTGRFDVDVDAARRFPREYAGLAYILSRSGYPVTADSPTRGGPLEDDIQRAEAEWLHGGPLPGTR